MKRRGFLKWLGMAAAAPVAAKAAELAPIKETEPRRINKSLRAFSAPGQPTVYRAAWPASTISTVAYDWRPVEELILPPLGEGEKS